MRHGWRFPRGWEYPQAIAGWFRENPKIERMMTGGTPPFGKPPDHTTSPESVIDSLDWFKGTSTGTPPGQYWNTTLHYEFSLKTI